MTGVDNTVEVSIPVEADAAAALSDARARIDMLPWIEAQEAAVVRSGFDADDWIAQTWAYDRHNVGDTMVDGHPALGGDRLRARHGEGHGAADDRHAGLVQPGRGSHRGRSCHPGRALRHDPLGAGPRRGVAWLQGAGP